MFKCTQWGQSLILLLLYLLSYSDKAVGQHSNAAINHIIIEGINDSDNGEVVQLKVFPYYFDRRYDLDATIYECRTINGHYKFKVPVSGNISYISLFFKNRMDTFTPVYFYLIEALDSILITNKGVNFTFSGLGSTKLECQYRMDLMHDNILTMHELDSIQPYAKELWFNGFIKRRTDSAFDVKLAMLNQYKDLITKKVFDILRIDCIGQKLLKYFNEYDGYLSMQTDSLLRRNAINFYRDTLFDKNYSIFPDSLILLSRSYADALAVKATLDQKLLFNHFVSFDKLPSLEQYFSFTDVHFNGLVREKIKLILLIRYFRGDQRDTGVFNSYIATVKDRTYLNILNDMKLAFIPGNQAYPFSLVDSSGKRITLEQFRGKAIVMDFWFKGCSSCRRLEDYMKFVRKQYKDDSNIVFISVNVDEKRQAWISGLRSKMYCGPDELNLFTSRLGVNHPFVKFYQYQSMPQLLIIDRNQRMVSSYPTPPVDKSTEQHFKQLIARALFAQAN